MAADKKLQSKAGRWLKFELFFLLLMFLQKYFKLTFISQQRYPFVDWGRYLASQ